jgi:hypothetical protein
MALGSGKADGPPACRGCFLRAHEKDEDTIDAARCELTLVLLGAGDDLAIRLAHGARRFAAADVEEILEQFAGLLAQVGAADDTPVDAFSLLTPRARAMLDDPAADLKAPATVPVVRRFDDVATAAPGRNAVTQEGRHSPMANSGAGRGRSPRGGDGPAAPGAARPAAPAASTRSSREPAPSRTRRGTRSSRAPTSPRTSAPTSACSDPACGAR